jgi:ubiquitin-activating enzyme E1
VNAELRIEPCTLAEFMRRPGGICADLDRIAGRPFIADRAAAHAATVFDGGADGATGHFRAHVPHVTEICAGGGGGRERFALCTLAHFPTSIAHAAAWARERFDSEFCEMPQTVVALLAKPDLEIGRGETVRREVVAMLTVEKCSTFRECVAWARRRFEEWFGRAIRRLQEQLPESETGEGGLPFWSGAKRFPHPIEYNRENRGHAAFVQAAAVLRARVFGIAAEGEAAEVEIDGLSCDGECSAGDFFKVIRNADREMALTPVQYEKDNDVHVSFVWAAANVRAENYSIEPATWLAVHRMAGRVVPEIVTTAAVVAGFVALEMYKVHAIEPLNLTSYRNGSFDLETNSFSLSVPQPPAATVCPTNQLRFTDWDSWIVRGDVTLSELVEVVARVFRAQVYSIYYGNKVLYSRAALRNHSERLRMRITQTVVEELHEELPIETPFILRLAIAATDQKDNDVPLPMFTVRVPAH